MEKRKADMAKHSKVKTLLITIISVVLVIALGLGILVKNVKSKEKLPTEWALSLP